MAPYQPRIADAELTEALQSIGCVVLEGPKAVGKTATALRQAGSALHLDIDANAQQLAAIDPALVLPGATPRLIDEWQIQPQLWNHVRHEVDRRGGAPGQFILTGSAVPADDLTRHTGAGRMSRLRIRPMSLLETGHSSGLNSLTALFTGAAPTVTAATNTIEQLIDRICIGGWPAVSTLTPERALQAMQAYLTDIARTDIHRVDQVRRDPIRVERTLRSLARNVATEATITKITSDVGAHEDPADRGAVSDYLRALERLMIIEDVPAWAPALRSRARARRSPKRHFIDPCLAVAALGASPTQLLSDLNYTGFLFESLVVRDLRVYLQHLGGTLSHYRDDHHREVDLIAQTSNGQWAPIEVKLGNHGVEQGAQQLLAFLRDVDLDKSGPPAFTAIITGNGIAHRRPDGILVLPLDTLAP